MINLHSCLESLCSTVCCLAVNPIAPLEKSSDLPSQYSAKSIGVVGMSAASKIYRFAELRAAWLEPAAVARNLSDAEELVGCVMSFLKVIEH